MSTPRTSSISPDVRLPGTARLGLARTSLELLTFVRERDAMIFIFAYPLIMMAIFATVFDGQVAGPPDSGVSFAQYFVAGIAATGIMLTSFQTLATSIAVERDDGTLRRLRTTPLPPTAYFLGKVGQVMVVTVVQMAALIALATTAFDVPLPDEPGDWLTFGWVLVLGTATGTVLGVAFSSVPRSGRSATAVVAPLVLVLQFISGVFFPFYQLPGWMQDVASVFPLKWMAQGLRSVFLPDEAAALEVGGAWDNGVTAAVLGAWLVVGLLVGVRTFRWRRRDDG
ncbi:ABC-2 type transport system permease protein [Paraoerskovia marina]|uniref:ABC-2 type transport system permease protein n=1 Tax=Paraoerskovia marina TaxID=545619 RepID=A0A1H1VE56_9CELL|nr:ABC transporter permease [Paraoerskovia marina]SDS83078.1 ABC-2 type transport system permease protein [Paraoerskovia marina]